MRAWLIGFCFCLFFVGCSSTPFVTTWRTNSSNEAITLPFSINPASLGLSVDWGDGNTDANISTSQVAHVYNVPGLYNVSIDGNISGFRFNNAGDKLKLVDIVSWGNSFFMDANSTFVFNGCSNLQAISAPSNTQPAILAGATLAGMFANSGFNSPLNWNLANVTSLASMFQNAVNFNQPVNFTNSQGVTDTSAMFYGASYFNSPVYIDTSNVLSMSSMFSSTSSFNQLVNFNTGKVQLMSHMFDGASAFNQPISFNTSSLRQTDSMFHNALSFNGSITFTSTLALTTTSQMFSFAWAFDQPITFQTDNVVDMSSMFYYAIKFNQPLPSSTFNTGKVQGMHFMFSGATVFNQPLNFNTTSLQTADYLLQAATSFNSAVNFTSLPVLSSARGMFYGATSFNQPLHLDTGDALTFADSMFYGASALNSSVTFTNTRKVASFSSVFSTATSFNQPVTLQTDSATDMGFMFSGATSFNKPVSFSNTSNVDTMAGMFQGATSFNQPIDFQATKLTTAVNMFAGAVQFNSPVVLRNTGLLTSTANMFANATNFNSTVSLSTTENVTNMNFMFVNVTAFGQSLLGWNTSAVTNCSNFCEYCGLPSFPLCSPCGGSLPRVSPSRGSVCNCPEPNCVAPPTPAPSPLNLCSLAQVKGPLEVDCLSPAPTPAGGVPTPASSPSPSPSVTIISPLFNITHGDDHGNGSSTFVFTLPINPEVFTEVGKVAYAQPCGTLELSCEWQDPTSLKFRQSGCAVTKSNVDMGSGVVGTECTCTHLTVFAIALRNAQHLAPLCHASEVDYVLLSLYALLAACLLVQLARLVVYKVYKLAVASVLQHSLLLVACALRMAFISAKPVIGSLAGLVALGLLPSAISLILFIYLMLAWTSLQLMSLGTNPFDRFRVPFVMIAIAVLVLIIALTIAVELTQSNDGGSDDSSGGSSDDDSATAAATTAAAQLKVVVAGSYVLAALYALVCVLVLLAGLGLRHTLSLSSRAATGSKTSSPSHSPAAPVSDWRSVLRWRVLVATLGLSSCLLVSAFLWVAAVQTDIIVSDAATLETTTAFYVSDWLSLCVPSLVRRGSTTRWFLGARMDEGTIPQTRGNREKVTNRDIDTLPPLVCFVRGDSICVSVLENIGLAREHSFRKWTRTLRSTFFLFFPLFFFFFFFCSVLVDNENNSFNTCLCGPFYLCVCVELINL